MRMYISLALAIAFFTGNTQAQTMIRRDDGQILLFFPFLETANTATTEKAKPTGHFIKKVKARKKKLVPRMPAATEPEMEREHIRYNQHVAQETRRKRAADTKRACQEKPEACKPGFRK